MQVAFYDPNTGYIETLRFGTVESVADEIATSSLSVVETEELATGLTHYVSEGEVLERPSMGLTVSQNPFRIDDIPAGTVVTYPGGTVTVDDGFIEWSASEPGEYKFTLVNFPYLPETVYADIT